MPNVISVVVVIDEDSNEAMYVDGKLASASGEPTLYACDFESGLEKFHGKQPSYLIEYRRCLVKSRKRWPMRFSTLVEVVEN